jgi:hypothetical protein
MRAPVCRGARQEDVRLPYVHFAIWRCRERPAEMRASLADGAMLRAHLHRNGSVSAFFGEICPLALTLDVLRMRPIQYV